MPEIVLCCENHSRVGNLPQSCRHNTSLEPLSCSFVSLHPLFLTLSSEFKISISYCKRYWIYCLAFFSPFTLFLSHVHGDKIVTDVTIYLESSLSLRNGFSSQNICRQNCFRYYSLFFTFYWVLIVFAHTRINWPWLTPNLFGGILDWFPPGSWYPLDLAELIDTSTLFLPPYHCPWLIIYLFHLSRKKWLDKLSRVEMF